jgi:putative MATE family efflux protein
MKQTASPTSLHHALDTDRIGRLLFHLSMPVFLGMFVQTMYNVMNTIFVGHNVGPLGIAGLSIVFPIQMLGMGMGQMVGIGGMSLISRYIGAGRSEDAEKALGNGLSLGILISVIVMALVLPLVNYWLRLIGATDEVLPFARDYLSIVMYALPFQILSLALLNYTRAEGNARVGMVAMILGAVTNIIFDATFIAWLGYGVKGAAWATFISQAVSLVFLALYYFNGNSFLKVRLANLRLKMAIIRPMFSIGVGAFVQTVSGSLSAMILINSVVHYGGDYALSAFGIIQRIFMFAIMPSLVLAQGAQPILGYNYGARRFGLAMKVVVMAFAASTILGSVMFLFLYFIPAPMIRVFTNDTELISVAVGAAKFMFLGMPLLGFVNVGLMVFQAIGRAVPAFIVAVARQVLFLIPIVLIVPRFIGLNGLWLSFPGSDLLTTLLVTSLVIPVVRGFRRRARSGEGDPDGGLDSGSGPETGPVPVTVME